MKFFKKNLHPHLDGSKNHLMMIIFEHLTIKKGNFTIKKGVTPFLFEKMSKKDKMKK